MISSSRLNNSTASQSRILNPLSCELLQRHSDINLPILSSFTEEEILNQERPCSSTGSVSSWHNNINNIIIDSTDQSKEMNSYVEVSSIMENVKPSIRRPVRFRTASISTFVSKSGESQRRKSLKAKSKNEEMEKSIKTTLKRPLTTSGG